MTPNLLLAAGRRSVHLGYQGHGYLGDEQLTGCQLFLIGLDLAVGVCLRALQLLAAVDQRLDLRLHLADVEASDRELLLHSRAVPIRLAALRV